jgi:hypothetical protein
VGSGGTTGSGGSGNAGRGGSGGTAGSGGTGGSSGTAGSGGTGGVTPRDAYAYVLWSKPDIARIWTLDKTTGNRIAERTLSMTASHGTGWSARDFDALRDGTRRLVWTRPAMGETLIWVLDAAMNPTAEIANTASDPKQGWFSVSYARLADGKGRLLWFNTGVANAVLWPLGSADTYDGSPKKFYTFTSGTGVNAAAPVSYVPSPDGTARILWDVPGAGASVWHLDPLDDRAVELPITLPRGYAARSYSVMDTGRVRIGLGDDAAGSGLVCTFRSDGTVTNIPAPSGSTATGWGDNQCYPFGPEASWTFAGYAVEDCAPGSCPAPCVDTDRIPHLPAPPDRLSKTALYAGTGTGTISPRALAFEPAYELWSDGAVKTRHAYIPKCAKIDSSDMDHWSIPVGSRFWKQFRRDGVLVETRLIHRYGPGPDDWIFASYQWPLNDPSDAILWPAATGVQNANGTQHDIPSEAQCKNCHTKLAERILSFSAIQLTHNRPGVTMASLSNGGRLTVPNAAGFPAPGAAFQQAALGYLHANCGNCHNSSFAGSTLRMRLLVGHRTVQATDTYTTATNVPTTTFACNGAGVGNCDRIEPNNPAQSAIIMRMSSRVPGTQMPPLGTELVHTPGVNAVSDWIIGF